MFNCLFTMESKDQREERGERREERGSGAVVRGCGHMAILYASRDPWSLESFES
jgi:hypothetical protein